MAPEEKKRRPGEIPALAGPAPLRWTCYVIAAWLMLWATVLLYFRLTAILSGDWRIYRGDGAPFILLWLAYLAVRWGRSRT